MIKVTWFGTTTLLFDDGKDWGKAGDTHTLG